MPRTAAISTLESSSKAESISTSRSLAGNWSTQASTWAWCWAAAARCSALKPVGGQHARQFGHVVGLRPGLGAALAVEHDVPDDADEPDAVVAHFVQRVAMAQHAQKRLLHGVFGVGGIAQDGKGDAIERRWRTGSTSAASASSFACWRASSCTALFGDLHPTCE